jgi:hypothetical protein
MQTNFYTPTRITPVQLTEQATGHPSIAWKFDATQINKTAPASSKQPLYTISGLWMERFLSLTDQLWFTGFNIPNNLGTPVGIELELNTYRQGRIQDITVQLCFDGELIGMNHASLDNPVQSSMYTGDNPVATPAGDYHVYGTNTDMWATELTSEQIADSTFGIVIGFKSNTIYPHRDLAHIDQVGIRVTYA